MGEENGEGEAVGHALLAQLIEEVRGLRAELRLQGANVPQLLTSRDLQTAFKLSAASVENIAAERRLRAVYPRPGSRRYHPDDVNAFIRAVTS